MTVPAEIGDSKYISLTTYRKDGTAVATPVWQVPDGDRLVVVSEADAWKVRRIRNNGKVLVSVCDFRGRVAPGTPRFEATARLLDETGTKTARALLARKYLMSRLGNAISRILRIRRRPVIGIAVMF
jgi:PPOX class probable F420-dependent enzyme